MADGRWQMAGTESMRDIADKNIIIIGLTGSSGSGKSEAARMLSGLGAHVIDADAVSHEITDTREVLAELREEFGDWVVGAHGGFDRALASKKAFADSGFLKRLTGITHKYIIKEVYRRVAGMRDCISTRPAGDISIAAGVRPEGDTDSAAGVRGVIVIDAPLPVEKGFLDLADTVWVVSAPRSQRLERIMSRDGLSREAAGARLSSQLSDEGYERLADVIINNGGGIDELRAAVTRNYEALAAFDL